MPKGFEARERKLFRRLKSPAKIQQFLDEEIAYNQEPHGDTCYSPRQCFAKRIAHCMEGALVARWRCGISAIRRCCSIWKRCAI